MSSDDALRCDVIEHVAVDGVARTVASTPNKRVFYYSKTSQVWLPVSGVDSSYGDLGGVPPFKGTPTKFIGKHTINSALTADELVAQHPVLKHFNSLDRFLEASRILDERSKTPFLASRTSKACTAAGWPLRNILYVGQPTQRFVMPDDLRIFEDWFKQAKTRVY